jgi:hypothetical protein
MDRRKNLKTFEQYLTDYYLSSDIDDKVISNSEMKSIYKEKYSKLYLDYLLMKNVIKENINENRNDIIISLNKNNFENDVDKFYNSIYKSKYVQFLTPYSKDDLKEFKLYKLKNYNIGFAIKKDGEIILVHNNENIGGIGDILIKKAISFGGDSLDYFDGYLTGFYKRNGFNVYNNDIFNIDYISENWNYEKIDFKNENTSIYVNEIKVSEDEYIDAFLRYSNGMPDVVYRKLK